MAALVGVALILAKALVNAAGTLGDESVRSLRQPEFIWVDDPDSGPGRRGGLRRQVVPSCDRFPKRRIRPARLPCHPLHGMRCFASRPAPVNWCSCRSGASGCRQATLSGYWAQVKARAGLDFDFYLAGKHYGVHLLYKLGLSSRAISAQMGWSENAVEKLFQVYGHIDLIALGEVDALRPSTDAHTDAAAAEPAS